MDSRELAKKIVYPNSLVGRSILVLFLSPLISLAIGYAFNFLKTFFFATCAFAENIFSSSRPLQNKKPLEDVFVEFLNQYFAGFVYNIQIYLIVYFDKALLIAVVGLVLYAALRFARNSDFDSRRYFKVWVLTLFVACFYNLFLYTVSYFHPPIENWEFSASLFVEMLIFDALVFFALYCFVKFTFVVAPYKVEPVWVNGVKPDIFFRKNFALIGSFFEGKKRVRIFYIIVAIFGINMIQFALETYSYSS